MDARFASASQELSGTAAQFAGSNVFVSSVVAGSGLVFVTSTLAVTLGATGSATCGVSTTGGISGSATTGSACCANLSSTPAAIAAAQASPLNGTGAVSGLASIVVVPTAAFVSAASARSLFSCARVQCGE